MPKLIETPYNVSIEQVAKTYDTNTSHGLSTTQARQRLEQYGKNELEVQKHSTLFQKFIAQFKDFMILVLIVAAIISVVVNREWSDAIIILLVVVLNAIMGVFQESKAEEAIDALQNLASPNARVMREGVVTTVKSHDLVPGDLVLLEAGDVVPADLRLIRTSSLQIEEAALTGESVPVEKDHHRIDHEEVGIGDRSNMAFSSTNVTYGRGTGIVVATGMDTEVGHIAQMLATTEKKKTPLQRDQDRLGKVLTYLILAIAVITFGIGVFLQDQPWDHMLLIAISLAVAAIPEGLPAISTIILSLGTKTMADRNALVRTLPAVETLGGTQIICSDKTGTLTLNQMTVEKLYMNGEFVSINNEIDFSNHLLRSLVLANDTQIGEAQELIGDPTETALIQFALDKELDVDAFNAELPRIDEIPFDSTRKLMTTIHRLSNGEYLIATKGAPDQLLERCTSIEKNGQVVSLDQTDRQEILDANQSMAQEALRVLAGAYKVVKTLPATIDTETVEQDLVFAGLVGMIDPERQEAAAAIEVAKQAGMRTIMITGDHAITAQAIAERLGILDPTASKEENATHVVTGSDLNQLSDEQLKQQVADYSVYARVSPEHKVRIIKAWQANDKVVSMTGDGVNDAPSLKQADIGVGMGITGTEVSKGASDMVLADDNFETIVVAVEEGRKVFANIQKAVQFLLSANLGEVLTLLVATMFGWNILEPVHILWINLVTDVFPAIALGMERTDALAMKRPPRSKDSNFLSFGILPSIIYQGILEAGLTLFVYWYVDIYLALDHQLAETMAFATLGLIQLFHTYNVKSTFRSLLTMNPFDNKYLNLANLVSGVLLLGVILIPGVNTFFSVTLPTLPQWGIIFVAAFSIIILTEIIKAILRATGVAEKYEQATK